MNKKNKKLILFLFSFAFIFFAYHFSFAQEINIDTVANSAGLSVTSPEVVIGNIIKWVLGILGAIGLIIVIIAGFIWMTSGGNEEKISKAKKMMVAAFVGIAIILASYIIVSFILKSLGVVTDEGVDTVINREICTPGECVSCNRICNSDGTAIEDSSSCSQYCSDSQSKFIVSHYSPKGNNVSLCSKVQVSFSANVKQETVGSGNFNFYKCSNEDCSQKANITSSGSFVVSENVVQFRLNADYEKDTKYYVELPVGGIKDINDRPLYSRIAWYFSTGEDSDKTPPKVTSVFPEDNKENICTRSHIRATFSEEMDLLSLLNADSFKLFNGDNGNSEMQFGHFVSGGNVLKLKPNQDYGVDSTYRPFLNGEIIQDLCGNKLDGNGDGTRQDGGVDNYPSNGPSEGWNFKTGQNSNCNPKITGITPSSSYYDGEYLKISGEYLDDPEVIFNNQVSVIPSSESCMKNDTHWFGKPCAQSEWSGDRITLFVPIEGGASGGAKTGTIKIKTMEGEDSIGFDLLSPRIDSISPDIGGTGQFITVYGSNFGDSEGANKVYFRSNETSALIEAKLPCAESGWNDDHIIIAVPEGLASGFYEIQVKIGEHYSNLSTFNFNNEEAGPGICGIDKETVKYEDKFNISGKRFGDNTYSRDIVLGNDYNFVTSTVVVWNKEGNDSQDNKAEAVTPNLSKGSVGVRVVVEKNGIKKFSNSVPLGIAVDASNEFKITYISPTSSPVGGYVTIYGSGFGNSRGDTKVLFKNGDSNNWFDGNFSFPSICSTNYWKNDRIVVKVPDDFADANIASKIKVKKGDLLTNEVDFSVRSGEPGPSICSINPTKGKLNDSLEIGGEYFTNGTRMTFSYNDQNNDVETSYINTNKNSLTVLVPNTKTGQVILHNETVYGNTSNFEYDSSGADSTENRFDFYGWHFSTCETCKNPQVKVSPCVDGQSSPSPYPGSRDVPVDAQIDLGFEYSPTEPAEMKQESLVVENFILTDCGTVDSLNCESGLPVSISKSSPQQASSYISFDPDNNLLSNHVYKMSLRRENIKDVENNILLNDYSWTFSVDPNGGICKADRLTIRLDAGSYQYGANYDKVHYSKNGSLSYSTHLSSSRGCYSCENRGNYSWGKIPADSLVANITPTTASSTNAVLNSSGILGSLEITATNTTFSLFNMRRLIVTGDCGAFNSEADISARQEECIDVEHGVHPNFSCCWDATRSSCVDSGEAVCENPFVYEKKCKIVVGGQNQLASPSPSRNLQDAVVDSIIHVEFQSATTSLSMNMNTYLSGISIKSCGSSETLENDKCNEVNLNLKLANTSNNSAADYIHDSFSKNTWYKIILGSSIQDTNNNSIATTTWQFKTGTDVCRVTNVAVSPSSNQHFLQVGQRGAYSARCSNNRCEICNGNYIYNWGSSLESIATIDNIQGNHSNVATATALSIGYTNITATNTNLNLFGYVRLRVKANCSVYSDKASCSQQAGQCCWNSNTSSCTGDETYCSQMCSSYNQSSCTSPCCWSNNSCTFNGCDSNCSQFLTENNCKNDSSCCWHNNSCISQQLGLCSSPNNSIFKLKDYYPKGNGECPNTLIRADFESIIDQSTVAGNVEILDPQNNEVGFDSYSLVGDGATTSKLMINIKSILKSSTNYKIILSDRVKSTGGASLDCDSANKEFIAINGVCSSGRCTKNDDCDGGACFNGFCRKRCGVSRDCGEGYSCVSMESIDSSVSADVEVEKPIGGVINGACVKNCSNNSQCSGGDGCIPINSSTDYGADAYKCLWNFKTSSSVCNLNNVVITEPNNHYYEYLSGNTSRFFYADARTSNGKSIVGIPNVYDWAWNWQSQDETIVAKTFPNQNNLATSSFKSLYKNGKTNINVRLSKLDPVVGYNGSDVSDTLEAEVFICESGVWNYYDWDYGFRLQYCKEGGLPILSGSPIIKDVPNSPDGLLREYIFKYSGIAYNDHIDKTALKTEDGVLKQVGINSLMDNRLGFKLVNNLFGKLFRGIFQKAFAEVSSYQNDVIGIRIYKNDSHVSPTDWYDNSGVVNFKGNVQNKKVDGYDAVVDGRTTYINAPNFTTICEDEDCLNYTEKVYTNIYLFSRNQDASPQTTNIYNQLINNLNFTNTYYCPSGASRCIDLAKDTKRWQDLRSMESKLDVYAENNKYCAYVKNPVNNRCPLIESKQYYHFDKNGNGKIDNGECYNVSSNVSCTSDDECVNNTIFGSGSKCVSIYPELKSGTYLAGITNSKWPSWNATLGNEIKYSMPSDPINSFGRVCSKPYNEETCWDDIGHRFLCPKNSKIYYLKSGNGDGSRSLNFKLYSLFDAPDLNIWGGNNAASSPYNFIKITNSDVCND